MTEARGKRASSIMIQNDPIYKNYIASERWKLKCEQYWAKKGRWCRGCLDKKGPLHVHHLSYDHFGREPLTDLIGLCYRCHREVHARHRKTGRRVPIRIVTLEFVRENTYKRLRKRR